MSAALRIAALICFVFAVFGFNPFDVVLTAAGLALWVGSELV